MRMFILFMFGLVGLAGAVLFVPPLRYEAEKEQFHERKAPEEGANDLKKPATEAHQATGGGLREVWDQAADTVTKAVADAPSPPASQASSVAQAPSAVSPASSGTRPPVPHPVAVSATRPRTAPTSRQAPVSAPVSHSGP
jgi:hypothetical protein